MTRVTIGGGRKAAPLYRGLPMFYIESFGGLWRLNKRAYHHLRKELSQGHQVDLDVIGKYLGTVEKLATLQSGLETANENHSSD